MWHSHASSITTLPHPLHLPTFYCTTFTPQNADNSLDAIRCSAFPISTASHQLLAPTDSHRRRSHASPGFERGVLLLQRRCRCRCRCRCRRRCLLLRGAARAAAGGEAVPGDSLGDEGYWEKDEGKKKLGEIEQMRELIAEAQKIRENQSAESLRSGNSAEENEDQRAARLREELARLAKEQAQQRKQAETMFQMGQRAYGRGVYDKSVALFEAALTNVPDSSYLGGEIQLWLAMAYEAHNRHDDCIALYKRLEKTHASRAVRRQAADLRYILEAPKLKISKDEMVSIPVIDPDFGSSGKTWSQMVRDRKRKPYKNTAPPTRDYLADWLVWKPPRWERSPYFWVAVTVWLTLAGVSLMFQD